MDFLYTVEDLVKDLVVFICIFIAALIGLFFCFLKSGPENRSSNRMLGLFLLVQAGAAALSIFLYSPSFAVKLEPSARIFLLKAEGTLILLEGFLLYWYTKKLLFKDFSWDRKTYAHVAAFLAMNIFWSFSTDPVEMESLIDRETEGEGRLLIIYALLHLTRVTYAVLCFINMARYRRLLENEYSNPDKADFSWLKLLVAGYLIGRVGWGLTPVSVVFWHYSGHKTPLIGVGSPYYPFLFDVLWLFTLSAIFYFALQYAQRFEGLNERKSFSTSEKNSVKKEHVDRVEEYMSRYKPYLSMDLKLDDLAQKLSLPSKTLSILLNVHYKKNFCEFINHYRVGEVMAVLSDPASKIKPVLDIALEAGFHSKSAFNRSFRKETGMTPLKYRQRALGAAAPCNPEQG